MTEHMNNGHAGEAGETASVQAAQPRFEEVRFYEHKPAGFWVRFWAYIIDLLVISSVTGILVNPFFYLAGWEVNGGTWYAPIAILSSIVFYAYFVLMTKFFRQTVGKMILGIRVTHLKSDSLSWGTVLFREWIGRFFSATIWPLYWIVGFTKNKQGVHDFIADTTVIHEQSYRKVEHIRKTRSDGSQLQEPGTV